MGRVIQERGMDASLMSPTMSLRRWTERAIWMRSRTGVRSSTMAEAERASPQLGYACSCSFVPFQMPAFLAA